VEGQISLSELNSLIKDALEVSFPEQLWVIAEIGELNVNRAGHCYLDLIEKNSLSDEILARTRATIWSWQFRFIQPYFETTTGQSLKAGLKVLVSVSIEFHEVYGLSLNIKDIDPNYTLGDMARKRQETINRLMEEGVFDMNKEIPLADIPSRIAIISSPTAAGFEDFMNQLLNNEQGFKFYTKLFAASMQGKDASATIIQALDFIYEYEECFDAVVIIRGGGSQMDLSCFDSYDLAFHITQFPLPVLTGIGHEKDESITDLVANTKLKTPTAVAEFLISCLEDIAAEITDLEIAFFSEVKDMLSNARNQLNQSIKLLKPLVNSNINKTAFKLKELAQSIQPLTNKALSVQNFNLLHYTDHIKSGSFNLLKEKRNQLQHISSKTEHLSELMTNKEIQVLTELNDQLKKMSRRKIEKEKIKLGWLEKTNHLIDPKHILKKGFSISMLNGKAIKNADELKNEDYIETIFFKGKVKSKVKKN